MSDHDEEIEINMTPMLDVVFILLIFFIVTAVFVKQSGIDVDRPLADTGEDVKRVSTIIGVSGSDEIWIDNNPVGLDQVRPLVSKFKQENPKGKIVIKADTQSSSQTVIQIVEQLNLIGVSGVAIATDPGGQS